MKRNFMNLAIAGILICTSLFGAACASEEGGTGGGSGSGAGEGLRPGDVVTDADTVGALLSAVTGADLSGFTFAGTFTLSAESGTEKEEQSFSAEGTVRFGETTSADAFGISEKGEYFAAFARKDALYFAAGSREEGETNSYAALKEDLKKEDGIVLDRRGLDGSVLFEPTIYRLLRNAVSFASGTATKTEGGYSLAVDVIKTVEGVLDKAAELTGTIEEDLDMTASALFGQAFVKESLEKLLAGVSAVEIRALAEKLTGFELPEAGTGTAKSYLEGLLLSGEFYTALTAEEEGWDGYRTFGEVPVRQFLSLFTEEPDTFPLKDTVLEFKASLKERVLAAVLNLFGIEGKFSDAAAEVLVDFSFDDAKKPIGFTLAARAEGTLSPAASEIVFTAESAKRFGVRAKAEAALSNAELFDLTGCRYHDAEGGTETIA